MAHKLAHSRRVLLVLALAVPNVLFAVTLSHVFTDGTVASAEQVNTNFTELKTAVDALEGLVGTYCGVTPSRTGNLGGYAAAKALCVTACGSPKAHMCTAHEVVMSAQRGISMPSGAWYSSGTLMTFSGRDTFDCDGWLSASSTLYGPEIFGGGRPDSNACSESHPVACCL